MTTVIPCRKSQGARTEEPPGAPQGSRRVSPAARRRPHPEPLLRLVPALQTQHDDVGVQRCDLQLMLLLPHLLLLVDDAAAQQAHVQLRAVVLGGFVALEGRDTLCPSAGDARPGPGPQTGAEPWPRTAAALVLGIRVTTLIAPLHMAIYPSHPVGTGGLPPRTHASFLQPYPGMSPTLLVQAALKSLQASVSSRSHPLQPTLRPPGWTHSSHCPACLRFSLTALG